MYDDVPLLAQRSSQLIPADLCTNPRRFLQLGWPHVHFYDKQWEIVDSVLRDDETVVPAGNELGKDFLGGWLMVFLFGTRRPCRIITSSAKDDHLIVLWSEYKNFVKTSRIPLTVDKGGPLIVKHREVLYQYQDGTRCEKSYIKGMVANDQTLASLGGHHIPDVGDGIPRTFWFCDESSSVHDDFKKMVDPWARRKYIFGNTYPCNNFFYRAVKGDKKNKIPGGDIPRDENDLSKGYYRKVIPITAYDSPNVKYALAQKKLGIEPDNTIVIQGVKTWEKLQSQLKTWDPEKIARSIMAQFYEGEQVRLFPKHWLDRAEVVAELLDLKGTRRVAKGMGVDPAEGGDMTAIAVVDELGLIDLEYCKTPNTAVIKRMVLAKMRQYGLTGDRVLFDRGGGGKQISDELRELGHDTRTVGFGEAPTTEIKWGKTLPDERLEVRETKGAYKNLRAEMYGELAKLLDPTELPAPKDEDGNPIPQPKSSQQTWGIPARFSELRLELEPIPKLRQEEEVLYLPPKHKKNRDDNTETLTDLIGHSPDLADATVLAVHAMRTVNTFVVG